MFLLKSSDLDRITKEGQRALRTIFPTTEGKALFKYLRLLYCENTCLSESDRETVRRVTEKEFVERLYKEATGKIMLEDQENYTNE